MYGQRVSDKMLIITFVIVFNFYQLMFFMLQESKEKLTVVPTCIFNEGESLHVHIENTVLFLRKNFILEMFLHYLL